MISAMCQARLSARGLEIAKGAHERRVDPTLNRMPFEGEGRIMFAARRDMRSLIASGHRSCSQRGRCASSFGAAPV
jgi:hypothetical protein